MAGTIGRTEPEPGSVEIGYSWVGGAERGLLE